MAELVGDGVLHVDAHAARGDVPRRARGRVHQAQGGGRAVDLDVGVEQRAVRVEGDEGEGEQRRLVVPAVVDVVAGVGRAAGIAGGHGEHAVGGANQDQILVGAGGVVADDAGRGVRPLEQPEAAAAARLRGPARLGAGHGVEHSRAELEVAGRALDEGDLRRSSRRPRASEDSAPRRRSAPARTPHPSVPGGDPRRGRAEGSSRGRVRAHAPTCQPADDRRLASATTRRRMPGPRAAGSPALLQPELLLLPPPPPLEEQSCEGRPEG